MNENITYCTKCGSTLLEEDKFCASCGSEVRQLPSAHKHPDPAEVVKPEPPTVNAPAIPIWKAAGEVNIEAVKQHLAAGTDVNARNAIGWTPLHEAVQCSCLTATLSVGHLEIIELLISKGADVNAKGGGDRQQWTPLHLAVYSSTNRGKSEMKKIVELLIEAGANVNAKDGEGNTPLDAANLGDFDASFSILRKYGGKTDKELKAESKESIHAAAKYGNIEAVKQHLAAGTDVNAKDNEHGWTPLHLAALNGEKEVVELLIDVGANVNAKNKYGDTPLHYAAKPDNEEIIKLLIENSADLNENDCEGITLLHYAAGYGQKDIVELLISKGADLNAKNSINETTPLYAATYENNKEIVELLISKGAVVNDGGDTPLNCAIREGHTEIANLLRKHGGKGEEIQSPVSSVSRASSSTELPTNKELFSTLKTCNACGNPVSTDAEKCPQCGKQYPTTTSAVWGVIKFVAVFVVIYIIIQVAPPLWDDYQNWKQRKEMREEYFRWVPN